jgi:hypothetical protein
VGAAHGLTRGARDDAEGVGDVAVISEGPQRCLGSCEVCVRAQQLLTASKTEGVRNRCLATRMS